MDDQGEDPSFFFLHVRKTAGTTLVRRVSGNFTAEQLYPSPNLAPGIATRIGPKSSPTWLRGESDETLARVRFFSLHQPLFVRDELSQRFSRAYFTITLLREPIARTVSHITQLARGLGWTGPLDEFYAFPRVRNGISWNSQLLQFTLTRTDHDEMTARGWTGQFGPANEAEAQNPPINLDDDRIAAARRALATVDAIGFTDTVNQFVDGLATQFGWNVAPALRANVSRDPGRHDRLRKLVASDAGPDIAFYEYARALVASRARV